MIESVFTLALATQLLLPGYLFRSVRRKFFLIEADTHVEDTLLNYAATSLLMLAITWPAFTLVGFDPIGALIASKDASAFMAEISNHAGRWFLQIVIAPAVLAFAWAYVERKTWHTGILEKIGLPPVPRHPSALQAALWAHRDKSPILRIVMKDRTKICGVFANKSAATAGAGWPDLFLSQVYQETTPDTWVLDESSSGIFIPGSEIRTVQFFVNPESMVRIKEPAEVAAISTLKDDVA